MTPRLAKSRAWRAGLLPSHCVTWFDLWALGMGLL